MQKEVKLYIVSGKARHGKSTVSDIIVDYYNSIGESALSLAYGKYIKDYAVNISDWDGNDNNKPRELLQRLGTEIIRRQVDPNFFTRRICEDIKIYSFFNDVFVISDARYADEIDVPKATFINSMSINVFNPNVLTDLNLSEQNHLSETSLDSYDKYDYIIINDGSYEDLKNKVIKIIKEGKNES